MLQNGLVASMTVLHQIGGVHGLLLVRLVLLGAGACCRIDLFQLGNGKGRFRRVLAGIALVKVYQIRLTLLQFCDNQSHLQTPVPQMDIAGHLVTHETAQTLYTFADDGRAEMSHMQRLRHVGSAVVDDDGLRVCGLLAAQTLVVSHTLQVLLHIRRCQLQVQEARIYRIDLGKQLLLL